MKTVRHSLFGLTALISATPAIAEEPPIVLPPITVVATWSGNSTVLCSGMGCSDMLGSIVTQSLIQTLNDEISSEDITFVLPVQDVPDNPYNQETGANCASDEEIRTSHANQDVGQILTTLSISDVVRIHYNNGDTELGVIECTSCSVPVRLISSTCG